ncbi:MAG: hypothetical protein KDI74_18235 [Gammaproteobacteria bacterium]|nr:hypothetical protein [Gammaproteobacteria bacterium]
MSITKNITLALLAAMVSFSALADSGHHDDEKVVKTSTETPMAGGQMPMMAGQKGGMPMMEGQGNMPMMGGNMEGMPMMQMMQERQAMMQAHMTKMETHMANIEGLLKQLVELQMK